MVDGEFIPRNAGEGTAFFVLNARVSRTFRFGVQAVVNGRQLLLGGPALLRQVNAQIAPTLQAAIDRAAARGRVSCGSTECAR